MEEYIKNLPDKVFDFKDKDKERKLDEDELKLFEGIIGKLNWVSHISLEHCFRINKLAQLRAAPTVKSALRIEKEI